MAKILESPSILYKEDSENEDHIIFHQNGPIELNENVILVTFKLFGKNIRLGKTV